MVLTFVRFAQYLERLFDQGTVERAEGKRAATRGRALIDNFRCDLTYVLRALRSRPEFSTVGILSLGRRAGTESAQSLGRCPDVIESSAPTIGR